MTTHARVKAIMLMVVSSFCSHQCSGHSICPTKHALHVCERERDFARQQLWRSQRNIGGEAEPLFVRIGCLICSLEWEIIPHWIQSRGLIAWVITQGAMQQEPSAVKMGTWLHGHICLPEKSIVLVYTGQSQQERCFPHVQQLKHYFK